jgi:uncharacterized repeat protein (TIGR03803 family)
MVKLNWGVRACGIFLLWTATAVALPAQTTAGVPPAQTTAVAPTVTFTTLHSFDGMDGYYPDGGLVQATDGKFYGTTYGGGANGYGTVFKITSNGTLTTLHSFDNADGYGPSAALIQGTNGDFYGTTLIGGNSCGEFGCGTVFKITPSGKLTTLYNLCSEGGSSCTDGANPEAGLVQATNGKFYGTTSLGGTYADGTVFKITPSGKLTTLHSFDGTDGSSPYAGLVQATNGNLYGTTTHAGAYDGTIFKITPNGVLTTLHSFDGTDGDGPIAGLIQGTSGYLYGTTIAGGANGLGTVFKITPSGMLTTLHSFDGTDGASPWAGLVQGTNGNFYGTTEAGGASNACSGGCGTVFKITPNGTLTTLHSFDSTDGANPTAGLVQATNGNFYGTTEGGGANGLGTVFSLSVGLGLFVETHPTSGKVGAAVKILGTKLTGATSVTFNGTSATFTVKSKSEITTTVPTGATTGTVQVVTPGGTLSSNVPFRVTP